MVVFELALRGGGRCSKCLLTVYFSKNDFKFLSLRASYLGKIKLLVRRSNYLYIFCLCFCYSFNGKVFEIIGN